MAKSHWQGRPAENINVSSRSKTSVMGGRFGDSPGILDARAACVKVACSGAGRQATNDERRCFLLRGRAYQRRMQEASAALTPVCIGRRLHRGTRMRGGPDEGDKLKVELLLFVTVTSVTSLTWCNLKFESVLWYY